MRTNATLQSGKPTASFVSEPRQGAAWRSQMHPQQRWLQRRALPFVPAAAPTKLLFIDSGCDRYPALVSAAAGKIQIVLIDAQAEGIGQIAHHLQGRRQLDCLLIAAADETGTLTLGSTNLTVANLYAYEDAWRHIGGALHPNGHIRLLGRGMRTDRSESALLAMLSRMTGIEVVASREPADAAWAVPWLGDAMRAGDAASGHAIEPPEPGRKVA